MSRPMNLPNDLRYTREHEWVRVDGTTARVGITDYAQDALGDIVYVELPEAGRTVAAMAACAEVESTKSVSDIYAPVTGVVLQVNEALSGDPGVVNSDPYGGGWLCVIEPSSPDELDQLLDAAAYRALTEG